MHYNFTNLFIINKLSNILDLHGKKMSLLSYGIVAWGQSVKTLTRRIFVLQKRAVYCKAKTLGIMQR
jgi:hypothetical protein